LKKLLCVFSYLCVLLFLLKTLMFSVLYVFYCVVEKKLLCVSVLYVFYWFLLKNAFVVQFSMCSIVVMDNSYACPVIYVFYFV